jgi:RNA polymerase sigma-70 factor (ECF subfamily)
METISKLDFSKVYNEYKPIVQKEIGRRIKCQALVEDLTADVFEKVFKHLKTYDIKKASISTWIITIAHNTIIDHYRKEGNTSTRFVNVDNFVHDGQGSTDTSNFFIEPETTDRELESKELKSKIVRVFATLKPKQREVAVMYFKQNLQYTDIANVLEIPLNTVKVTIMRIREVLQAELKHEYASL